MYLILSCVLALETINQLPVLSNPVSISHSLIEVHLYTLVLIIIQSNQIKSNPIVEEETKFQAAVKQIEELKGQVPEEKVNAIQAFLDCYAQRNKQKELTAITTTEAIIDDLD